MNYQHIDGVLKTYIYVTRNTLTHSCWEVQIMIVVAKSRTFWYRRYKKKTGTSEPLGGRVPTATPEHHGGRTKPWKQTESSMVAQQKETNQVSSS